MRESRFYATQMCFRFRPAGRSEGILLSLSRVGLAGRSVARDRASPATTECPRTVTVSEAETPPVIRAGILQSTLVVLPTEEKVANVFAGDTVDCVIDGGHVASRFISERPKVANGSTATRIRPGWRNGASLPERPPETLCAEPQTGHATVITAK